MSGRGLMAQGLYKVLNESGKVFGLVLVEATAAGSVQRWLFRYPPTVFRVVPWLQDMTLSQWKERVTRVAAARDALDDPSAPGLWWPASIYITAKSTVYSYGSGGERTLSQLALPLPEPSFVYDPPAQGMRDHSALRREGGIHESPQREMSAADRQSDEGRARSRSKSASMPEGMRQIDLGSRHLYQGMFNSAHDRTPVGHAFAAAYGNEAAGSFENTITAEYWLLLPGYQAAGPAGGAFSAEAGNLGQNASLADFVDEVGAKWGEGCQLEVTGCNNYRGTEPPPAAKC